EIGRISDEAALTVVAGHDFLSTGFDGGLFRIFTTFGRSRFDGAEARKIPAHRSSRAELSLLEQVAHVRSGAVLVVSETLDDDGDLVRCEPFVDDDVELHAAIEQTGALLDGSLQSIFWHR